MLNDYITGPSPKPKNIKCATSALSGEIHTQKSGIET